MALMKACSPTGLLADRLAQEVHRARVHRPPLLILTCGPRDKNDGERVVGAGEVTLEFQAVHFRHPHVENETRGVFNAAAAQEFKRRGEGLGSESE